MERILLKINDFLKHRYCIIGILGQGGFGISYLALDILQDKEVVVKEYFPYGKSYRNNMSQIIFVNYNNKFDMSINEASVLNKLQKFPGIVKILDFFLENNTAYLVMEYCKGITLQEMVRRNGKMGVLESSIFMKSLQKCLEIIHTHGIIHRDICPENIIITEEKEVKLIDFGSALDLNNRKCCFEEATYRNGFSPPEQYEKNGRFGVWTDNYAFCATWYYCLTNSVPLGAQERLKCDTLFSDLCLELKKEYDVIKFLKQGMALDYKKRKI